MANEIYDSTWWGNTIQTASSIGTSTEMIQGQFNLTKLGDELVTNGTFDTDSDWNTSSTGISISGGKLSRDATATTNIIQINSTIKPSVPYQITFEIVDYTSGTLRPRFGYNGSGGTNVYGVGVYTQTITKLDQDVIELYGPSFIGSIDNVSVKLVRATTVEASKCLADAIHRIGIQDIQN